MIRDELSKENYEMWQPPLGGPGVMCHLHKPDTFINSSSSTTGSRSNTPAGSSHHSTPAVKHKKWFFPDVICDFVRVTNYSFIQASFSQKSLEVSHDLRNHMFLGHTNRSNYPVEKLRVSEFQTSIFYLISVKPVDLLQTIVSSFLLKFTLIPILKVYFLFIT